MFPVAGVEKLAGGDTGSEPYKGKKGAERWQKMRENVIKEWEAEQAKKGASTDAKQSESVNTEGASTSTIAKEMQTTASGYDGSGVAATHAEEGPHKEEKDAKSNESKLHKLKDKLFKH